MKYRDFICQILPSFSELDMLQLLIMCTLRPKDRKMHGDCCWVKNNPKDDMKDKQRTQGKVHWGSQEMKENF